MPGQIVTFYSYKGGAGRTMSLCNVGWILAANGYNVLLVDWDIAAPGLQWYLRPFLKKTEDSAPVGLTDFFSEAAIVDAEETAREALRRKIEPINWRFRGGGAMAFLSSGRARGDARNDRNGVAVAIFRETVRADYDYILIDSPAGVGGEQELCTSKLADLLVIVFALNHQNIAGAVEVAEKAQKERGIPIMPVPAKVEHGEVEKADAATRYARRAFRPFLASIVRRAPKPIEQYWLDVEIPYVSFYAFEEVLAVLKEERGSRRGLVGPSERLCSWIVGRTITLEVGSEEQPYREQALKAYLFSADESEPTESPAVAPESDLSRFFRYWNWRFSRRGWAILAACVVLVLAWQYIAASGWRLLVAGSPPPVRIEELLTAVADDLQKIEAYTSERGDNDFPKSQLSDADAKLRDVQDLLRKLKVSSGAAQPLSRTDPNRGGQPHP